MVKLQKVNIESDKDNVIEESPNIDLFDILWMVIFIINNGVDEHSEEDFAKGKDTFD